MECSDGSSGDMTQAEIEQLENGRKIEMYISPTCPYCVQARAHFDKRGVAYMIYDAQGDHDARKQMFAYSKDDPTVPVIVVDGSYVQSGWGSPPRG
jgi:glutaredoxin 3